MRKTIRVETLKEKVNDYLLHAADGEKNGREAQILLIESVLMETGNYNGFKYLNEMAMRESNCGTTVGIRSMNDDGSWDFKDTDHTRVYFY